MTGSCTVDLSRRSLLVGLGASALTAASAPAFANAPAIMRGAGDYRSVSLISKRTAERLSCVYWADGEYIPEALAAVDHLMRDWRQNLVKPISVKAIDIIAATHLLLDTSEPFEVVSGYRSERTNAMLRRSNRGVARQSYHVKAMAADLKIASRSSRKVAAAAMSLGAGGVGRYSRSQFTHIDCGPVRVWGR